MEGRPFRGSLLTTPTRDWGFAGRGKGLRRARGVLANESPQPSRPPFVAPHQLPCTPRTPRNRYLVPERASTQCCMQSCSAPLLPSPQPHQLAACTTPPAWLDRPSSRTPCRPPFATQWSRQGGQMSPAPHHLRRTKPPGALKHRTNQLRSEYECKKMYQRTRSVVVRQSVAPFCGATTLNFFPPRGSGGVPQ